MGVSVFHGLAITFGTNVHPRVTMKFQNTPFRFYLALLTLAMSALTWQAQAQEAPKAQQSKPFNSSWM